MRRGTSATPRCLPAPSLASGSRRKIDWTGRGNRTGEVGAVVLGIDGRQSRARKRWARLMSGRAATFGAGILVGVLVVSGAGVSFAAIPDASGAINGCYASSATSGGAGGTGGTGGGGAGATGAL